jgi:hypothetical protein
MSPCESPDLTVSCFETLASLEDDGLLLDVANEVGSPCAATAPSAGVPLVALLPSSKFESLLE